MLRPRPWLPWLLTLGVHVLGCKPPTRTESTETSTLARPSSPIVDSLTLRGYTTAHKASGKAIIPAFVETWKKGGKRGAKIGKSYPASGAQTRAIVGSA